MYAEEQGQVIVHCLHYGCSSECGRTIKCEIALSPDVQLLPNGDADASKLIQSHNIGLPPTRNFKKSYCTKFTLVFSGLPKDCIEFDFFDPFQAWGGWHVKKIERNKTYIYYLNFSRETSWHGETQF